MGEPIPVAWSHDGHDYICQLCALENGVDEGMKDHGAYDVEHGAMCRECNRVYHHPSIINDFPFLFHGRGPGWNTIPVLEAMNEAGKLRTWPSSYKSGSEVSRHYYEVIPLTFNRSRLIHTDGLNVGDFWEYVYPVPVLHALCEMSEDLDEEKPPGVMRARVGATILRPNAEGKLMAEDDGGDTDA